MAITRGFGRLLGAIGRAAALALGLVAVAAPSAQAAGEFVFPQSGPCTSSYYSQRSYGYHAALDIAGPNRSAITAARAGQVTFYGVSGGYGNLMIVTHEAGYTTYYAHLTSAAVGVGTRVSVGQTIAYEGSTGNSTGPHVHFEVRRYGTKQYVPGNVGNTFTRGNALNHTYAGLAASSGGQSGGGSSGSASSEAKAYRVTASSLNVRSGPSTSYGSIGLVGSGQVYVSSAKENGWHKVWFNGRQGWSSGQYLSATGATVSVVNTDALNVRSGPSTSNAILKTVSRGQRYARAGTSGAWTQVWFDGQARWMHGDYLSNTSY